MAEATDRPQSTGQVPPDAVMQAPSDSPITGEAQGKLAPLSSVTYQPLSLLALAGFGLAVVYALVVLLGGAVALFGRIPWLMPGWTFMVPIAILILCWAARTRIQNSEATLSGLAFTTWGFRLAILFGLTYTAYYVFTFFAVRLQAVEFANSFFEELKKGHADRAFLLAQGLSDRGMNSDQMRDMLESRFNQPAAQPTSTGFLTRFRQEQFVRFIEMDGSNAKITPQGVSDWEYGKGGYRMILNYHVATSLAEYDMRVETFRRDPKPDEPKDSLKWQVLLTRGETAMIGKPMATPRGQEFMKRMGKAQAFAMDWAAKSSDPEALKPAECERLNKLIQIDEKKFWGKNRRAEIIKRARNTFQLGSSGKPMFSISLQPPIVTLPLLHESEGRTTVLLDAALRYFDDSGVNLVYLAGGRLVVSAENDSAAGSQSAWRVDALEIDSGRTPPDRRRSGEPNSAAGTPSQ